MRTLLYAAVLAVTFLSATLSHAEEFLGGNFPAHPPAPVQNNVMDELGRMCPTFAELNLGSTMVFAAKLPQKAQSTTVWETWAIVPFYNNHRGFDVTEQKFVTQEDRCVAYTVANAGLTGKDLPLPPITFFLGIMGFDNTGPEAEQRALFAKARKEGF